MTMKPDEYWFPAKLYGWGWGLPSKWQGWVVLLLYVGVLIATPRLLSPRLYVLVAVVATGLMCGILWLKGEPPNWRWGRD